jgi:chromobox protein 3
MSKSKKQSEPEIVGEDDDDAEEEFVVEKIVDARTTRAGKREYFLKWKGYPE